MASPEEQKAAFAVVDKELNDWIQTLIPDQYIPFVGNLRQMANQKLNSPQGQQYVHKVVNDALAAAEKVRAAK